jgi:hypothetical protein
MRRIIEANPLQPPSAVTFLITPARTGLPIGVHELTDTRFFP